MQSCDRVTKCPFTSTHLLLLYCTKDDRDTTLYTLLTTPSVTVARKSSVHAYLPLPHCSRLEGSEAEILNILKLP